MRHSTKWKETYRMTWPVHFVLLKMSIPGVRFIVFTATCVFMILFSLCCFGEHDRMEVEICGYSARSISLPFPPLSLTHCGSVGQQKDISGAATRKKKKEKCMKWWTASEDGSHATQSRKSKVTLALSKETDPLCWRPRLYLTVWMSKFITAW